MSDSAGISIGKRQGRAISGNNPIKSRNNRGRHRETRSEVKDQFKLILFQDGRDQSMEIASQIASMMNVVSFLSPAWNTEQENMEEAWKKCGRERENHDNDQLEY